MLYAIAKAVLLPFAMFLIKDVKGIDNVPKGGFVLASNHTSHLDPIILPAVFVKYFRRKVRYLAKEELFRTWFIKVFIEAGGAIPIDRTGTDKSALGNAIRSLKAGDIVGIFPEGGRSRTGKLQKGKTGVARLALGAKVPVVPAGIIGTYEIWPAHKKVFKLKKAVTVNIGKPIYFRMYYNKKVNKKMLVGITRKVMKEIAKLSNQHYMF
jgi:1-acyl-sn-glycerol-3-phosphate acyltransferase